MARGRVCRMVESMLRIGFCCGMVTVLWMGCGDTDSSRAPAAPSIVRTGGGSPVAGYRPEGRGSSAAEIGAGRGVARDAIRESVEEGGLKVSRRAEPVHPVGGMEIEELSPALVASNAEGRFVEEEFTYEFELREVNEAGRTIVEEGTESQGMGSTSYQVDATLKAGEDYEWRVRATFGEVADAWSDYASFSTAPPLMVGAPTPEYPVGGATISTLRPVFKVRNGETVGDVGIVINEIQVSLDGEEFSNPIMAGRREGEDGVTAVPVEEDLMPDSRYYWRARARANGQGATSRRWRSEGGGRRTIVSDWSESADFRTPEPADIGPTNGPSRGDCCPPPRREDILRAVHAATGRLFKKDADEFTQRVAECLAVTDGDWGRRLNGNGNLSDDTVGYRVPGRIPFSIDVIRGAGGSNPHPRWAEVGQRAGSWLHVDGSNCVLGNVQ